jgi:hypothetical protein
VAAGIGLAMALFLIAGSLLPVLASARGAPNVDTGAPVATVNATLQADAATSGGIESLDDEDDDALDGRPSDAEAAPTEVDETFGLAAAPTVGVELSQFEQVPLPLPSGPFGRVLPPPLVGAPALTPRESTPALALGRLGAPPLAVPRIDEPLQAVAGLIKAVAQPGATGAAPTPTAPTARTFPRAGGPSEIATTAIVANAERLLGIPYVWGGNSTSGLDCSAYVSMVWGISRHTTDTLPSVSAPIAKDELVTGDALNLPTWKDPQGYGHVRLFDRWANAEHTSVWVYEETSATGRSVHRAIAYDNRYQPIRRVNYAPDGASLAEASGPSAATVAVAGSAIGPTALSIASPGALFATTPVGGVGRRSEGTGSWWETILGRGWSRQGATVAQDEKPSADAGLSPIGAPATSDASPASQPARPVRHERRDDSRPTADTPRRTGDTGSPTGRTAGDGNSGSPAGASDEGSFATATPRPTRAPRSPRAPTTASASPTAQPRHDGWRGRSDSDDGAGRDGRPSLEPTAAPSSTATPEATAARPRRRAAVEPTSADGVDDLPDVTPARSSGSRRDDATPEPSTATGADATPEGSSGDRHSGATPDARSDARSGATPETSSGRRGSVTPEPRTSDRADAAAEPSSGPRRAEPTAEPRTPRGGTDERRQSAPAAADPTARPAATPRPENTAAPERRVATPQAPQAAPPPAPSRTDEPKRAENSGSPSGEGRRTAAPTTAPPPKAAAPAAAEPKRSPSTQQASARPAEQPRQAQPARSNGGGKGR